MRAKIKKSDFDGYVARWRLASNKRAAFYVECNLDSEIIYYITTNNVGGEYRYTNIEDAIELFNEFTGDLR